MASCERCWRTAGGEPDVDYELIKQRQCTPEEQAGDGGKCSLCGRWTIHQYAKCCMNPLCQEIEEGNNATA